MVSTTDRDLERGAVLHGEVADALQGPATSKVTVALERGGEALEANITRRRYALVPVRSALCAPAAGTGARIEYIRLTTFNQLSS